MIFSATVPQYIQEIAMKKLKEPILIDLVGTDTTQIPSRINNICVLCNSDSQKHTMLKDFVLKNQDKKIMIFTETKDEAK
jgi:superfamily II DNA/RNA helicase